MIGALLGAGAGLVGAGLQASAQNNALALDWMNLQFQKENARKQQRFAQAGRQDAFGNKQRFDDALNEWLVELTPTQSGIVKAGEREQKLSLTEDAARNRDIRRAAHARGLEAGEDYNRARAGYRYDQPKSEAAIRDELTSLLVSGGNQPSRQNEAAIIRAAIRQGQGANIGDLMRQINEAGGGPESLAQTMLKAREMARSESAQRSSAHDSKYLTEMNQLAQLMDAGGGAPTHFSTVPDQMRGEQGQISQQILASLVNEGSQVGGAFGKMSASAGKSPDLSSVASALSRIGQNTTSGSKNSSSYMKDQDRMRMSGSDFLF